MRWKGQMIAALQGDGKRVGFWRGRLARFKRAGSAGFSEVAGPVGQNVGPAGLFQAGARPALGPIRAAVL
jgi:hypothetical protein